MCTAHWDKNVLNPEYLLLIFKSRSSLWFQPHETITVCVPLRQATYSMVMSLQTDSGRRSFHSWGWPAFIRVVAVGATVMAVAPWSQVQTCCCSNILDSLAALEGPTAVKVICCSNVWVSVLNGLLLDSAALHCWCWPVGIKQRSLRWPLGGHVTLLQGSSGGQWETVHETVPGLACFFFIFIFIFY